VISLQFSKIQKHDRDNRTKFGVDLLPRLKRIHIQKNKLTEIPPSFMRFSELPSLNLSGNLLTTFPAAFSKNGITPNLFRIFDVFFVESFSNLTDLDLSGNPLTSTSIVEFIQDNRSVKYLRFDTCHCLISFGLSLRFDFHLEFEFFSRLINVPLRPADVLAIIQTLVHNFLKGNTVLESLE